MSAEVLVIGPFSLKVARVLSYRDYLPPEHPSHATVVDSLFNDFGCCGSTASRVLAVALGADAYDANTYHINPNTVDLSTLQELVGAEEYKRFTTFRDHGFVFFFRPNG